jgi:hypothetical protein
VDLNPPRIDPPRTISLNPGIFAPTNAEAVPRTPKLDPGFRLIVRGGSILGGFTPYLGMKRAVIMPY